jgi:hypothetical protein
MRAPRLLAALLSLAAIPSGHAIVIYGGTGVENATAPANDPGWAHVGSIGGATGVYLGSFGGVPWALTAAHVGAGTLQLDSGSFAAAGAAVVIRNPDGSATDLAAFPLTTAPLLPNLSLAGTAPAANSTVLLMGTGSRETGALRYWSVAVDPTGPGSADTWTELPNAAGSNLSGYNLGAGGKRWGGAEYRITESYSLPNGPTQIGVMTLLKPFVGSSQAAGGDSGGAIFFHNGTSWGLLGIISAVGTLENQPANTAVTFNQTLGVSIPEYRTALLAAIPEPGHYALGAGALSLLAVLWHRRRRPRR